MKRIVFGLALAAISFPQMGFSQDSSVKADLIAAIGKLSQRDVALVGSIDEEAPEEAALAGGLQRIVVSSFSSSSSADYQGAIEILAAKNGELVIASKEDLPGIKVFKAGEDVLSVQAHLKEPFSTAKVVNNVSKLLDWSALGTAVESASKVRSTPKGKETEIRVVLDANYIPNTAPAVMPPGLAAGGIGKNVKIQVAGGPMQPSIIELTATFMLNSAKEVVGVEYMLQYDDPMKGMMAKVMKGGGGAIQIGGNALAKPNAGEADLGKLIIYDFDVVATTPQRVTEFATQAKTLLKNRK